MHERKRISHTAIVSLGQKLKTRRSDAISPAPTTSARSLQTWSTVHRGRNRREEFRALQSARVSGTRGNRTRKRKSAPALGEKASEAKGGRLPTYQLAWAATPT